MHLGVASTCKMSHACFSFFPPLHFLPRPLHVREPRTRFLLTILLARDAQKRVYWRGSAARRTTDVLAPSTGTRAATLTAAQPAGGKRKKQVSEVVVRSAVFSCFFSPTLLASFLMLFIILHCFLKSFRKCRRAAARTLTKTGSHFNDVTGII